MATIKWYNPDTDEWEYVGVGSSGGGSGDVVGPSSATDNAIARFDMTTGKLVQNSDVTISDGVDTGGGLYKTTLEYNGTQIDIYGGIDNYVDIEGSSILTAGTLPGYAMTFTNKRTNPRVTSTTSASSLTPTVASADQYNYTALAANLTINAPAGTPVDGNKLLFRIKDNGTSRTLTWNSAFRVIGVTLPTATTVSKTHYIGCVYNAADTKWDVIAVATET